MQPQPFKETLIKYIPEASIDYICDITANYKLSIKITNPRKSKLGDYRSPIKDNIHQITINNNLNKYAFLITLLHEIAHLLNWQKHKNKVSPHGKEWQNEFKKLLSDMVFFNIFPDDIKNALIICFFKKTNFSNSLCLPLDNALRNYSEIKFTRLIDVPNCNTFTLTNGQTFIKIEKLRKRFKCKDIKTGKLYLVNPLAKITHYE